MAATHDHAKYNDDVQPPNIIFFLQVIESSNSIINKYFRFIISIKYSQTRPYLVMQLDESYSFTNSSEIVAT